MLELIDVSKYYTANGITNLGLRNINLKFNKGEIVAITGQSGSGKSTLLNVIAKLDNFDDGEIYYKGNETSYFSIDDMDDFRKNKVGFIFQNYNIIDSYTVLENVMIPLILKGCTRKEAIKKARELLVKVKLDGKEKSRGSKLSGGEKQRCVIARALASDCEILACDEPTGNLDSKTSLEIIKLIKEVASDKLVLIVTHDFASVADIVTRKIQIADGEIVEDVIFQNLPDDENVDLDLDYQRLPKKVDFQIAKNNILFTPKKTTFVSFIFLIISLIIIFMFQFINGTMNELNFVNAYTNRQDNRVYVYDLTHQELDINKIKTIVDDYEINPFYEDKTFNAYIYKNESTSDYPYEDALYGCLYNDHVSYTLKKGIDIDDISDNDIIVIFPESEIADLNEMQQYLNKKISISILKDEETTKITCNLVGLAISSSIETITMCKNKTLKEALFNNYFEYSIKFLGSEITPSILEDNSKPTITLPKVYEKTNIQDDIEFLINGIYDFKDYNIIYSESSDTKLEIGKNYNFNNHVFEVSAYDNNPNKLAKKIRNIGYQADITSTLKEDDNSRTFIMNFLSYFLMITAFNLQIIFYIITYIILAKVYSSRKKDYEILRVLGISKKDMKVVVKMELFMISMTMMIVSFIIFAILVNSIKVLNALSNIKLMVVLLYVAVIIFLTYLISYFFNKRLFKFSVTKSLKGDSK